MIIFRQRKKAPLAFDVGVPLLVAYTLGSATNDPFYAGDIIFPFLGLMAAVVWMATKLSGHRGIPGDPLASGDHGAVRKDQ